MTHSGGKENLRGYNWSIERGMVDPDLAGQAAREILDAIALGDENISFDHEQPENRYRGYLLNNLEQLADTQLASATFGLHALMGVRDAIRPFKDTLLLADPEAKHYDQAIINIIAPDGKVPWHKDSEPWSLVFVSLSGIVKAKLQDIENGGSTEEILNPGDALSIVNPNKRKKRPKHELTNLSSTTRISYGENTRRGSA